MISRIERDKALGMLRGEEDSTSVFDPNCRVNRGMHYQQCTLQSCYCLLEVVLGDVIDELFANAEAAPVDIRGELPAEWAFRP